MGRAAVPRTVTDMRGTKLVVAKIPARIVSLAPGVTEMLYAVGAGKSVVGDTNYCDYPPEARFVAHIGDFRTNYEAVLALRPDLVVASDANRAAADKLSQLKVRVLYVAPTSYTKIEQSLTLIGRATGQDAGASIAVRGMEHAAHAAAALAKHDGQAAPPIVRRRRPSAVDGGGRDVRGRRAGSRRDSQQRGETDRLRAALAGKRAGPPAGLGGGVAVGRRRLAFRPGAVAPSGGQGGAHRDGGGRLFCCVPAAFVGCADADCGGGAWGQGNI